MPFALLRFSSRRLFLLLSFRIFLRNLLYVINVSFDYIFLYSTLIHPDVIDIQMYIAVAKNLGIYTQCIAT